MASVSKDEYNAVLNSLTDGQMAMQQMGNSANGQALEQGYAAEGIAQAAANSQGIDTSGWTQEQRDRLADMQNPDNNSANSQNLLDAIKMGAVGASMQDMQSISQNGLDPTQGPGSYNMLSDAAYLNAGGGVANERIGNANNVSQWASTTDRDSLMAAGNLNAARTHTMNQYAIGAITAEEAQAQEDEAFEQQFGSLEHVSQNSHREGSNFLSGESWIEKTITPTDYSNLSQEAAFLQAESHNVIEEEKIHVEGLGGQLFKMAVTGALTAGVGAALAPTMAGLSAGAQGAINGGLNSAIGGVVSGNGLDIKDIGVGALTGGVGGSLSNADGMLGGFIDTGSNLADDAIKGAITGGIGGAIDGDVLGGALTGGVSGAGMNLLEQGVGWAGDKIGGLTDDLTGPGEFDFASDVVGFEDDIFDQDLQAFDNSFDFVNSTEWDLDDQMNYDTAYDSLQEIVPGGEYREGIQFSETNNWITEDGQAIDRNDITYNQEIGEFTVQGTDTIVNEHANAITIDGQVVAYKDGESWTDLNGEPVTDPALVDFYTNQSTQSGDMDMFQVPERFDGEGNYIPGFSDNHGGSDNPDYRGTIFGESYQDSNGNNYTATDGKGWGIDTGGTNYADPGKTQDVYYNRDDGFYDPDATNNAVTNFVPADEKPKETQKQQDASESDPVNNTDTSLDSGEKGGGTDGTPSNPTDTAVGTIVANLEQEKLQAILNNNVELASQIEKEIEKVKEAASSAENSDAGVDSSTPTNNDPSPSQPNTEAGGSLTQEQIDKIVDAVSGGGDPTGSTNPSGNPSATPGGQNTNENGNGGLASGTGTGAGTDTGSGVQTGDGTGTGETGNKGGNGDGAGDPGIGAGFGGMLAGLGAGGGGGNGGGEGLTWTPLNELTKLTPWQKRRHHIQRGLLQSVLDTTRRA